MLTYCDSNTCNPTLDHLPTGSSTTPPVTTNISDQLLHRLHSYIYPLRKKDKKAWSRLTVYKGLRQISSMRSQRVGSEDNGSRGLVGLEKRERLLGWEQVEKFLCKEFGVSVCDM